MISKTMKNKVYHFKVTDPEIIVENIKKQELIAKRLSGFIKAEVNKTKIDNSIDIYNGREGVRKFQINMMNSVPKNGTIYIIQGGATAYQQTVGLDFVINKIDPIRIKKNILIKNVMSEKDRQENKKYSESLNPKSKKLRQVKFLPYQNIINPIFTDIWDNHVSFVSSGKDPFAIIIKNKEFYESYVDHFNILWKIAKK